MVEIATERIPGRTLESRERLTLHVLSSQLRGIELEYARPVPFRRLELDEGEPGHHLELYAGERVASRTATSRLYPAWLPIERSTELVHQVREVAGVRGVWAAPPISGVGVCLGSPAVGTADDAARVLGVDELRRLGLTGEGTTVAVVDDGLNLRHLNAQGRHAVIDTRASFGPPENKRKPGEHPVGHGTMCAYAAGIAAADATLGDCPVLLSNEPDLSGWLDDVVRVFTDLRGSKARRPSRPLIVTNSWAMIDPSLDLPVGDEGNYSDNPNHPLHDLIRQMEADGIDLLFAAGNCGRDCANPCHFGSDRPINGANSHPAALCVGAADVHGTRAGYSSVGPGRLAAQKPDVLGPAHFVGSGAKGAVDVGTSTACPAVAGLVAAVRARLGSDVLPPAELREAIQRTATRTGVDHAPDMGWGVANGAALAAELAGAYSLV